MQKLYKNKNLFVIAVIATVNALGYGIIIPILYLYSRKFGLSDFQNGLLFALFSACQFLASPIIGRMSDKFGRKPLLLISLLGTAFSFFMAAFAPNAIILFLSRALDGITAGNITVASAVISDTTLPHQRAKGFGIIGASFGFGFVLGPAISAFTFGFNESLPFIIAGIISLFAVLLTAVILPETNKFIGRVQKGKLFDLTKLFHALFDKNVGVTLFISLIYSFAFSMFTYAYQPFSVKIMHFSPTQIPLMFTLFGVVGIISQVFLISRITKKFGDKTAFKIALFLAVFSYFAMFFVRSFELFIIVAILLFFSNSFVGPLIQTILSKETDEKSQGSILGLNSSYISIGNIAGPIIGGFLSSIFIPYPFLAGSLVVLICFILAFKIIVTPLKKESAF